MLDWLNWSQLRLLSTLAASIAIVMEPVSWITSQVPPCMVNTENYSNYYAEHHECPTFHVFLIKFIAAVLEKLGDPNWVIATFTVVLAFSTIGLWIATKGLYETGEKQIAVAKESADAAKKSADVAEKALRLTQRAYVVIKTINSQGGTDAAGKLMVYIFSATWENTGTTPGLHFTATIVPTIIDATMNPKDVIINTDRDASVSNLIIPPHVPLKGKVIQISADDIMAAYDRKKVIFFWVRAVYFDVFDKTDQHETVAAFETQVIGDPRTNPPGADIFMHSIIFDHTSTT
jgi:hypothetical protein